MLDRIGAKSRPTLACALLLALLVLRALLHEPWRDELQAWSVVRASDSLAHLFARTRADEQGKAWYLCLFALDRVFGSFAAVQAFHASAAAAAVFVLVRWSPFTVFQKTAFALSYFAFFEYAVIARPYALAMLAVCAVCAQWDAAGLRRLGLFAALALLAATSVYGIVLAGALATAWLLRPCTAEARPARRWVGPLLVAAGAVAAGYLAQRRFARLSEVSRDRILSTFDTERAGRSLTTVTDGLLPLPFPRTDFWNSSLLRRLDEWGPDAARTALQALPAVLGVALLAAFAVSFARRRTALIVWVLGTGPMVAFAFAFYHGYLRHHGHVFLALVAASWLAAGGRAADGDTPEGKADRLRRRLFDGVLAVQALAGVFAATIAAFVPFSSATACARWVRERGLEDVPVVAYPDVHGAAVATLLGRQWYFPQGKRWGTFVVWTAARVKPVSEGDVIGAAEDLRTERGTDVLIVTDEPLRAPPPGVDLLVEFPAGIVPDESFFVYRLPARR